MPDARGVAAVRRCGFEHAEPDASVPEAQGGPQSGHAGAEDDHRVAGVGLLAFGHGMVLYRASIDRQRRVGLGIVYY